MVINRKEKGQKERRGRCVDLSTGQRGRQRAQSSQETNVSLRSPPRMRLVNAGSWRAKEGWVVKEKASKHAHFC